MEEKGMGFFKKIWTSIKDFEKYEEFAAEKLSKAIKYILLITLIFTTIISIAYTYKFHTVIQDVKEYISANFEELSLKEGKLNVKQDSPIIIENENAVIPIIVVDTLSDSVRDEYLDKVKLYNSGIIFLSDRVVVESNLLQEEQSMTYSSITSSEIANKDEFIKLFADSNIYYVYLTFFITIFIYLYIVYLATNFVDAFVLGVLGYLFSRVVRLRLRFKATFNIGIYALTLPIILNLIYAMVNTFTGFTIEYFQWMYTTISYIYVAVAILMIKTEITNQKIQLMRLEQIQREIKEQEQEPEKEEKEEKKEDKKEKENGEEKEKKDKQDGDKEAPEGSNA